MFNGIFDDIPVGKINFQYKTKVYNYQDQISKIKTNLEDSFFYNKKYLTILEELEERLNKDGKDGIEENQVEFNLTPRGTHFNTKEEEQDYNNLVIYYSKLTASLDFLGLKYKTCVSSSATNQYGNIVTPGPIKLEPKKRFQI